MKTRVKWVGKNTQYDKKWEADGLGYKDLVETIEYKYGINYILDSDAVQIKLLEINGENLDDYEVTSDGIGNMDKFEEFENKEGIKELSEDDYKDVLESSKGNAYYHNFKTENILEFYKDGVFEGSYEGYVYDLVEFAVSELVNFQEEDEYEDFILDLEQKVKNSDDLREQLDKYNNDKLSFKLK